VRVALLNITAGGMSGGYRKFLINMIPRLASHPGIDALLCASPASLRVQDWFKNIPKVDFIECRRYDLLGNITHSADPKLRLALDHFSPDIIFVPVDRQYRYKNVPVVNMIQNIEPLEEDFDGDPFVGRIRKRVQRASAKKAATGSDRVIAISEFVRGFLVNAWNIPPAKISLIYHGGHSPIEPGHNDAPASVPPDWKGRFLFTAGSIRPARGLEDVLHAMMELLPESAIAGLVIAGDTTPDMVRYREKLDKWVKSRGLSGRVCWAGNLNEHQMAWCYRNCSVFVMTSRVESFGMIGVEAMAHGCVCIVADNSCLPEIFGDAAVYYSPKDGKALAEAVRDVLSWDNSRRAAMSEKARKRSETFSWDVTAEKTMETLNDTLSSMGA